MTSELVLMNKNAAVIAADRAVTSFVGNQPYVSDTTKLFQIGSRLPVAVALYHFEEIHGHPWHRFINDFNAELGDRRLPHLRDYAEAFFTFVETQGKLFSEKEQLKGYEIALSWAFYHIMETAKSIFTMAAARGDGKMTQQFAIMKAIELAHREIFFTDEGKAKQQSPIFRDLTLDGVFKKYQKLIDGAIVQIFKPYGVLNDTVTRMLREICAGLPLYDNFIEPFTGLVWVGYGTDEYYPVCAEYRASIVFEGRLKRSNSLHYGIEPPDHNGVIFLFADTEATEAFLFGLSRETQHFQATAIQFLVRTVIDDELDKSSLGQRHKDEVKKRIHENALPTIIGTFIDGTESFLWERRLSTILQFVSVAKADALADTARELVKINNLSKQLLNEVQTVSNSVDVAVLRRNQPVDMRLA